MEKREIKCILSVGILFLIAGSFLDLRISHALYDPQNLYGKFFAAFATFPSVLIASFCFMGILVTTKKKVSFLYYTGITVNIIITMALIYVTASVPGWYFKNWHIQRVLLMAVLTAGEYMLALYCRNKDEENFRKAAVTGIMLFIIVLFVYNSIKILWGRERYRHMVKIKNFSGFSRWFIPRGFASGNDFMSFPSGHSANAAMTIWITLFPRFSTFWKGKEIILKITAYLWTLLSMFSRIVIGAHFLSDITVGVLITFIIFYALSNKIFPAEMENDHIK